MNFLRSPRNKLLAASAAILLLALLAPLKGASAATLARVVLGAAALGGFGWWLLRQKSAGGPAAPAPRLRVLSRAGLSQRCSMALVEADGREYLVVFGDGFAELQPAAALAVPPANRAKGRRPRPTTRRSRSTRKAVAS